MPLPANPRFVTEWEDSFQSFLLYVDADGNVTADFLEHLGAGGITGARIAAGDPLVRFALTVEARVITLRSDGTASSYLVHKAPTHPETSPFTVKPPVAVTGSPIAVDQARFVGRLMDRRIFVVAPDGSVLGYDVLPDGDGAFIHPPFAFGGVPLATDAGVRFCFGMNFHVVQIRDDGSVIGFDTDDNIDSSFLPPVPFAGPTIELSPEGGDFAVTMGTSNSATFGPQFSVVIVRRDGSIVAHSLTHHTVGPPTPVPLEPPV